MQKEQKREKQQQILFVTAHDMLQGSNVIQQENHAANDVFKDESRLQIGTEPAILSLRFPFELKPDQIKAAEAWMANQRRGSIIYGSGTGKTEIAFECARRAAAASNGKSPFNVVMLVPRIVLVEQNYRRLVNYGIDSEKIGRYFGEQKEIREITICTYHSAIGSKRGLGIIKNADIVIFDEVHLAAARAFGRVFDTVAEDKGRALLGLTATIDEHDPRNSSIMTLIPPARKYLIKDAVEDGRLARPIIFPIKVALTPEEQQEYNEYSKKIRTISARFKRYDANEMMKLFKSSTGFPRWQARAWFLNVRKRKTLLASADNKLATAVELIKEKHPQQKVMVFSETLESIRELKQLLGAQGIESALIDSRTPSFRRHKILSQWGSKFHALLSVHTLEIGYDVPEAGVEIILASTSNMNQIVQRIGRVLRKVEGKNSALVYVVYVSETKDTNILALVNKAIQSSGGREAEYDRAAYRKRI